MLRATIAGVSLLALSLAACTTPAPQVAASVSPAAKPMRAAVALEDKYATSSDGVKIHYVASGSGRWW
ncbi:MAG: hypothetical protein SGJ21_08765 [Alphaproteobacteria bacterium]|nr:hypothetical protein [Alphaproteobacteria bacterium]